MKFLLYSNYKFFILYSFGKNKQCLSNTKLIFWFGTNLQKNCRIFETLQEDIDLARTLIGGTWLRKYSDSGATLYGRDMTASG